MPKPALTGNEDAAITAPVDDIGSTSIDRIAEHRQVFIEGNNLTARLGNVENPYFCIAEIGFGNGLNFLLAWQTWLAQRQNGERLHYVGIDSHPLRAAELARILAPWPTLASLAKQLLRVWPAATAGCHRLCWPEQGLTLDLWFEATDTALADLASRREHCVDAWFFDDAASAKKTELQSLTRYRAAAQLSRKNATLASFSSSAGMCHSLAAAGFAITQRLDFEFKREAIAGHLTKPVAPDIRVTPWDLPGHRPATGDVLVLGAGLAGAHMARALAVRGFNVHVIEQSQIASGGSSNLQGITYTRLSRKTGTLADFAVASYQHAVAHYRQLFDEGQLLDGLDGAQSGYLQLSDDQETLSYLKAALKEDTALAKILDPEAASACLGINVTQAGIFYPDAFWLNPPAVCRALLNHPLIRVSSGTGAVALRNTAATTEQQARNLRHRDALNQGLPWEAIDANGSVIGTAAIAIIASALSSQQIAGLDWLPLQGIRGQTTHIRSRGSLAQMRTALCHEGYIAPAREGIHCIGATYSPNDIALDERAVDHDFNVAALQRALSDIDVDSDNGPAWGHVAVRCTSSDYLPLVGAVPDHDAFIDAYRALAKRRKKVLDIPAPSRQNLYLSTGFGSRGLTAAPLAAEMIASTLCAEPMPVPRYLQQALAPARFLIRDIIRGKR